MAGRPDTGARRRSQRAGRQRGCVIHISGEELQALGLDPNQPPPLYRVWTAKGRPRLVINLYPREEVSA